MDPAAPLGHPPKTIQAALADRLSSATVDLPPLPKVAREVVGMASKKHVDAKKLSDILHKDQALASQVLRIANSPLYMPKVPIESLAQAVARLGLKTVTEIAFAASVSGRVFRVPGYEPILDFLWRHSLASASYAKEIARVRGKEPEGAFLCGLLHGIGKPILLRTVADLQEEFGAKLPVRVVREQTERHHRHVGAMVAKKWKLPVMVSESIAYLDSYEDAPSCPDEAANTCLANRMATNLLDPNAFNDDTLRDHDVFADLNVLPAQVDQLIEFGADVEKLIGSMDR
jgi:putative nucleotidyltransferase with HDIG domain